MTLKPRSAPFGETGEIMEIHFGAVVQNNFAGKAAIKLAAGSGMVQHLPAVNTQLLGGKDHFQAVVIAEKVPGADPVCRGNMECHLIEFMELTVNKEGVFSAYRRINQALPYIETDNMAVI